MKKLMYDLKQLDASIEIASLKSREWRLPSFFTVMSVRLAALASLISCVILFGYLIEAEYLYRPIAPGPATHPATAILSLLLGICLLLPDKAPALKFIKVCIAFVSTTITLFAIIDYAYNSHILPSGIIFESEMSSSTATRLDNYLSVNTAVMLFMLSCAVVAEIYEKQSVQQLVAFIAIAIPCVSFIGYVYGVTSFYSHMSLYTAIIGFLLGWSILAKTSSYGGLRAILSPYLSGRIARFQSIGGMLLPFSVGLCFVSLSNEFSSAYIAVFVIFITWFLVFVIGISAYVQDQIDSVRREVTEQLIQAANTDPLTSLLNRRQFFNLARKELRRANRSGISVALLMIDIDDFKSINDIAGHDIGDQVLVEVANTLSEGLREFDLVCRFGGEEFCVLITDTTIKGLVKVCNKITASVRNLDIQQQHELNAPVTVSIGACLIEKKIDLESSLKVADAAMYQAKSLGKNQTYYSAAFTVASHPPQ